MTRLSRAEWHRFEQPVLSAMTSKQAWSRVVLYSPAVVCRDGLYRMWYCGCGTFSRSIDMSIGYAESDDGLTWRPHPNNPILIPSDIPFGGSWQTPFVMFDEDVGAYRMWFVSATGTRDVNLNRVEFSSQRLGHAISEDGLHWDVDPEPLFPRARSPWIIKAGSNDYWMWMNSAPTPNGDFNDMIQNIYRFTSNDGLNWKRDLKPVVRATDQQKSVVYPCVHRGDDGYTMWYGCHVADRIFELFASTSKDGLTWTHHRDASSFPATRNANHFDGRYTSTPFVIQEAGRFLLYYSARDLGNIYGTGDGTIGYDSMGIYRHIGVAELRTDTNSDDVSQPQTDRGDGRQ